MKRRREERATLDVTAMAPSGEGIAASGDRADRVLVAGALPGERLIARIEPGRRPRGRVIEIVEAHPERIAPPCPLAERCGGCDWMQASAALRERMHRDTVASLLARHGLEAPLTYDAIEPTLGYRDRARLALRARGRQIDVGYRAERSRKLVAVGACPVLHPSLERVFVDLSSALVGSHGEGEARVARGGGGRPVVELRFRGDLGGEVFGAFDALCRHDWAGARIWPEGATAPASYRDPRALLSAADGEPLYIAPGGFAQPSEAAARALGRHVAERAAGGAAVELFAGSGTLSVMAARDRKSYVAVESDPAAVETLRQNLASRGLEARAVVADANAHRLGACEVVILDPPRVGAPGAVERILEARPRRVVYVSCNPVTLARDLAGLAARYQTEQIALFDVFPQTSHLEAVATLTRS